MRSLAAAAVAAVGLAIAANAVYHMFGLLIYGNKVKAT